MVILGTVTAVSYTHLDVYKRQAYIEKVLRQKKEAEDDLARAANRIAENR